MSCNVPSQMYPTDRLESIVRKRARRFPLRYLTSAGTERMSGLIWGSVCPLQKHF